MFNAGQRPAVNPGISVSRVGGSAQTRAMKQVAGRMRIDLSQYRALEAFAQFGSSELDKSTRNQLERGQRTTELLKQPQYQPMSLEKQVMSIYAVTNGYADDVPVNRIGEFEAGLLKYMDTNKPDIVKRIAQEKEIKADTTENFKKAIEEFKKGWK